MTNTNPFRESIRDVSIAELTRAIDVSDLLLLCLQHREVLTPGQHDQILVRRFAVFSFYCRKTLYCVFVLECRVLNSFTTTRVQCINIDIQIQYIVNVKLTLVSLGYTDKENSPIIIPSSVIELS